MNILRPLRRHPAIVFTVLVFPLSWYQWLLGLADEPGNSGLNPLGPLAAGLITAGLTGGWRGVGGLLLRAVRVWARPVAWAAAVLAPIGMVAGSCALMVAFGAAAPTNAQLTHMLGAWPAILEQFIFVLLFVGIGEEVGWRGFLLWRLQSVITPLRAALVIGAVWSVWHAPLLRTELTPATIVPMALSVFAGSVVLAWIFNLGPASAPPTMVAHALLNTLGAGLLDKLFPDPVAVKWMYALSWGVLAALVVVATKGRLGYSGAPERAAAAA